MLTVLRTGHRAGLALSACSESFLLSRSAPPGPSGVTHNDSNKSRIFPDGPASRAEEMTPLLRAGLSPGCVTGVGSLPFTDAGEAVEFVAEFSPELPFWPQLPLRDPGEGVIAQGMGSLIEYLEPADQKYCWSVRSGAAAAFAAALERADAGLIPE